MLFLKALLIPEKPVECRKSACFASPVHAKQGPQLWGAPLQADELSPPGCGSREPFELKIAFTHSVPDSASCDPSYRSPVPRNLSLVSQVAWSVRWKFNRFGLRSRRHRVQSQSNTPGLQRHVSGGIGRAEPVHMILHMSSPVPEEYEGPGRATARGLDNFISHVRAC
jgi:hypothetical protein